MIKSLVARLFGLVTDKQLQVLLARWRREVHEVRPIGVVYENHRALRECTSLLVPNNSTYRN